MNALLGVDLAVVPQLVAQDASAFDLLTRWRAVRALPRREAGDGIPPGTAEAWDLRPIGDRENLAQALVLRLLTPRGALVALGHASYGSRLHELVGRSKTDALRQLCRAYVLEVVAQEPRVLDRAVALAFDPDAETPSSFVFTVAVQPRAGGDPLAVGLEVAL